MSSTFKLIAVKVEEGCAPHIKKNLEGVWYLFDKDYTIDEGLDYPKLKKDRQVPDNFFSTEEGKSPSPSINIHAIVGMNGSGKSALIDFILRLINNYSYAQLKHRGLDLNEIKGVRGKLVFEYSYSPYVLEQLDDNEITLKSINNEDKAIDLKGLFYTILLNYSIHALNTEDYAEEKKDEKDHWLKGLFHKNDGYQTPCVLTPQRLKGNININTENELSKDRLIAIALMNEEGNIGGGYKLTKLKLSLQEHKTLIKSRELSSRIVPWPRLNYADIFQETRRVWEEQLNIEITGLLRDLALNYLAYKSISIDWEYIVSKKVLGKELESPTWAGTSKNELKEMADRLVKTIREDKSHITNKIRQTIAFLTKKKGWASRAEEQLIEDKDITDEEERKNIQLNLDKLWEILDETCSGYSRQRRWLLSVFIFNHADNVQATWHRFAHEIVMLLLRLTDEQVKKTKEKNNTISDHDHIYIENIRNLLNDEDRSTIRENIRGLLRELDTSSDYIAQQFQEAWKDESATTSIKWANPNKYIEIALNDLREGQQQRAIYLVPPPIFDVELLVSKDGGKEIPLSKLSSGEKQLLYSSSSYLYHLLNLDSAHESQSDRIKYEYVNLICDEIELYFHPEYQRQFVDYMLKSIRSMNLKHIKAINILLSTHSPFILSDIPDAHVLYLKEGKPVNRQGETFGANIHELLRDAFFLNGMPIGDFAREKILKLNEKIEAVTEQTSLEELERLNKEISLIGEPILCRQLLKLLEKQGEHAKNIARVAQLENELNELRQRIEYDQNQSPQ